MNLFFWRKKKKPKRKYIRYFLGMLLVYLLIVLWPIKGFLHPIFWTGKHLILFTNEAEARPCGGFVTAFGTVSFLPPHFNLKNSYHFEKTSFGLATFPLSRVAERRNFWDLGDDPNLANCTKGFKYAYEQATNEQINQIILVDLGTIESILSLLDTIDVNGKTIDSKYFFSTLSRTVADIDQHDEQTLQERKTPLAKVGKTVVRKIIVRPWLWWKITQLIGSSLKTGNIYSEYISPEIAPEPNDFSIIEWNLGGGKSSRFLQKEILLSAYEVKPDEWNISLEFIARHLGGEDAPVSQYWKGVFQIKAPDFLENKNAYVETTIFPGESFQKKLEWQFKGNLAKKHISFFRPRGQDIFLSVNISHFPQKYIRTANFPYHENIGQFKGMLKDFRKVFTWHTLNDKLAPFITLHEVLPDLPATLLKDFPEKNREKYFYAEIHFNEPIELNQDFSALVIDRNFEENFITDHPLLEKKLLLDDNQTLVLQFSQEKRQANERFYLQLSGVNDLWGNQLKTQKRTLITR